MFARKEVKGFCAELGIDVPVKYTKLKYDQKRVLREWYVKKQNGNCLFCNTDLAVRPKKDLFINWDIFPPNFLKYPVHLQHDHTTLKTEGAVHAYCNAVLWYYHKK